jgi:hypothetical protein
MRELKLDDFDAEIARSAGAGAAPGAEPEALVVLLIPRGSPFEMYAAAMAPAIAGSHGKVEAVRIDTTAEPEAPRRFGLSGSPGIVLFVGGKQVAAFAVPMLGAMMQKAAPMIQGVSGMIAQALKGMLPPPQPPGGGKKP